MLTENIQIIRKSEEITYNKHRVQLLKCWEINVNVRTDFWCHYLLKKEVHKSHHIVEWMLPC